MSDKVDGKTASPYGYPFWDWVAKEDPEYVRARGPLTQLSVGEGKELSIKHREMVIIGILAYCGREEGVVTHMRRAVQHGATKRELLEAIESAALPGGGPTFSTGVQALMQLDRDGAFKKPRDIPSAARRGARRGRVAASDPTAGPPDPGARWGAARAGPRRDARHGREAHRGPWRAALAEPPVARAGPAQLEDAESLGVTPRGRAVAAAAEPGAGRARFPRLAACPASAPAARRPALSFLRALALSLRAREGRAEARRLRRPESRPDEGSDPRDGHSVSHPSGFSGRSLDLPPTAWRRSRALAWASARAPVAVPPRAWPRGPRQAPARGASA